MFAYHLHLENLIAQKYTVAMFLLNKHQTRVEKNEKMTENTVIALMRNM